MARILIADDDLMQLDCRKMLLEFSGHSVRAALGIADALRQARQQWADLLIVDLRMPEAAHGLALIRTLRESGFGAPIIVLSGWPQDLEGQPEEQMVSRVLVKPAPVGELLGAIESVFPAAN